MNLNTVLLASIVAITILGASNIYAETHLLSIESIPDYVGVTGETISFTVSATNTDAKLSFSGNSYTAAGSIVNATTGEFTWTPTASQTGTHYITFKVTDVSSPEKSDVERVKFTITQTDIPPTVIPPTVIPPSVTIPEIPLIESIPTNNGVIEIYTGETYTYTLKVTNYNDGLDFESDHGLMASTGVFSWNPSTDELGNHIVEFSAEKLYVLDGVAGKVSGTQDVKFKVLTEQPVTPTIATVPDYTGTVGKLIEFDVTVSSENANADLTTTNGITAPIGATFENHKFSWTPTVDQIGTHTIEFTVTDVNNNNSSTVSAVFTITSSIVATDPVTPTIATVPDYTGTVGKLIEFDVTVSSENANADLTTTNGITAPFGATFENHKFSWTPTSDQIGTHTIEFTVIDVNDNDSFSTVSAVFTITALVAS